MTQRPLAKPLHPPPTRPLEKPWRRHWPRYVGDAWPTPLAMLLQRRPCLLMRKHWPTGLLHQPVHHRNTASTTADHCPPGTADHNQHCNHHRNNDGHWPLFSARTRGRLAASLRPWKASTGHPGRTVTSNQTRALCRLHGTSGDSGALAKSLGHPPLHSLLTPLVL